MMRAAILIAAALVACAEPRAVSAPTDAILVAVDQADCLWVGPSGVWTLYVNDAGACPKRSE